MRRAFLLGIGLAGLAAAAVAMYAACNGGPDASFAQSARVDARVLEDTAEGRTGHFLVVLRRQADTLTAAGEASTRQARGRQVYDALRQAAGESQPAVRAQLEALGAGYRLYWIANVIAVEGDRAVVDVLAARGDVLAIETDRAFRVPLEEPEGSASRAPSGVEWNVSWIHAPDVWALGYTGQGITYANADTGVKWDHPALKPQYRGWNGATADHNYNWWDAIHADIDGNGTNPCGFSSPAPCDDSGHGTHTTGTGVGDDGGGNQTGVAPGAEWIACRNMDEGVGRPSTYIECMQFFLAPTDLNGNNPDPDRRPHAVGNSYLCPPSELCSSDSLQVAMENLRAAGVFMSVSAGNTGPSCSTISAPPALEDSAITVGATGFQSDVIASFSSRGPVTVDGSNRRKPDLSAPGVSVRSSYPFPSDTYASLSGTSMASPHVAGAVALLWSAYPYLSRNVDVTEFVLAQSAVHLTTAQGCGGDGPTQVPNNVYGYGRIDALAAYNWLATNSTPTPTPTPTVTPTPTPTATPGADTDGDGCADIEEADGAPPPNPGATGPYDPTAWYDFYDVPVPANADPAPSGPRDKIVNLGDVLAVLFYVGAGDDGGLNGNGVDYDSLKDGDWTGDTVVDSDDEVGRRYDRTPSAPPNPPWDAGPPDGTVNIGDVLAVLAQVGLDCSGPP